MNYTVFGSKGFIGSHLVSFLKELNHNVFCPERDEVISIDKNLGCIIYCIGLTADFRQRPMDTVRAHVCKLIDILENSKFDSFLYLSSTRVYNGAKFGNENCNLVVNPLELSDLYNISKLMGESICLSNLNKKVRVARISNVIGSDFNSENFLFSLIRDAVNNSEIQLNSPLQTSKDYISIEDVVKLLSMISENGEHRIYNVASGTQTSNEEILNEIKKYSDFKLFINESGKGLYFPQISIERIEKEFSMSPKSVLEKIENLVKNYKQKHI